MIKDKEKYNKQLVETIVEGMQDVKAHDIVVLDMREIPNAITDYFVICHGDSTTQVEAVSRSVEKITQENLGDKPWHKEGLNNSEWVLMDFVNVVVHIFYREAREFYDIESLWADAKITNVEYQA